MGIVPGGGVPYCYTEDYSGQFFAPQSADAYHVGDTIPLDWYAGIAPSDSEEVAYIEMLLSRSTSPFNEQTIFNETSFSYGAIPSKLGASWVQFDACHNTGMTYNWTIPATQPAGTNIKYFFTAMNTTDTTASPVFLATSQPFLILPAAADPSSSSSSTATATTTIRASSTGTPALISPTTSPTSTARHGLTVGGKIALGVSVPIGSIVLGLIGLWAWRRRLRADPKQHSTQEPDSSPEKYPAEIGGSDILLEADSRYQARHPDSSHEVKVQELDGNGNKIADLPATR